MSKNERVMDYLLDRIEVLEKEKRDEWFQKSGLAKGNEILHQEIDNLKEKIEQYQIEREHIKEIITCNINIDDNLVLVKQENDYSTLMSILDIKPGDYRAEDAKPEEDEILLPPSCMSCKYEERSPQEAPCINCVKSCNFEPKEVTTDAENTD